MIFTFTHTHTHTVSIHPCEYGNASNETKDTKEDGYFTSSNYKCFTVTHSSMILVSTIIAHVPLMLFSLKLYFTVTVILETPKQKCFKICKAHFQIVDHTFKCEEFGYVFE